MNQIPDWWLILTGIACVLFAIFTLVLVFMVLQLIKLVRELQKPVATLLTQVNDLVPAVKSLVVKVEDLTVKVEGIADSTRGTVDLVGAKAQGIVASVDTVAAILSSRLQQYAPLLGTVMTGFKLFNAYREGRAKSHPKVKVKAPALTDGEVRVKKGKVTGHRGVEQSGSSSGS